MKKELYQNWNSSHDPSPLQPVKVFSGRCILLNIRLGVQSTAFIKIKSKQKALVRKHKNTNLANPTNPHTAYRLLS